MPRGVLTVLTDKDKQWLLQTHPLLIPKSADVAGNIRLRAAYDRGSNRFVLLSEGDDGPHGALVLDINFNIRIAERTKEAASALPALHIEGVVPTPSRHFNQADHSACLCSPFEEREFLVPNFSFKRYLEELVIPFLYGQKYYSLHDRWPWREYSHGVTGLLQSYARCSDQIDIQQCLAILRAQKDWPRIRSALQQRSFIKGVMTCFCSARRQIRVCHPDAWHGIELLRRKVRALRIKLR